MAWQSIKRVNSNSNAFDLYLGAEGFAYVYRDGDAIRGVVNGYPFERPRPATGNVQQLRIRPDNKRGGWYIYSFNDPYDGARELFEERVTA